MGLAPDQDQIGCRVARITSANIAAAAAAGGGVSSSTAILMTWSAPLAAAAIERVVDVAEIERHDGHRPAGRLLQQQRLLQGVVVRLVDNESWPRPSPTRVPDAAISSGSTRSGTCRITTAIFMMRYSSPSPIDSANNSMMSRT